MTVFTGIVFLNMSFFLAEVSALKLDQHNKQMLENLVRSFSCVSEEERDASGGESHDSPSVKEVDLIVVEYNRTFSDQYVILSKKYEDRNNSLPKSLISDTPSQPPEA